MSADRLMRNMMQNMGMGMPFNGFFDDPFGTQNYTNPQHHQQAHFQGQSQVPPMQFPLHDPFSAIMPMMNNPFISPMPMSMMMNPFQGMQQAMSMATNPGNGGGFSYCSSSVTSYTTDEHGRPQVYQQSQEVKQGPSGIKETKSAVRDSRSGHQELSIGHHIKDKAHIKKKSRNAYSGEEEQLEDFVNLDENEAESFEQTWTQQARDLSHNCYPNQIQYSNSGPPKSNRLALTSGPHDFGQHHRSYAPSTSYVDKNSHMKTKKKKNKKKE